MTTNFPTSVDAFTNPTSNDTLDNPPHDQQHADINDAMEAVQTSLLDGSPLRIDDANNRVGVNDATPSYTLDVNGDINSTGAIRKSGISLGVDHGWALRMASADSFTLSTSYNAIAFADEQIDTDGYHSTSTNNTRVTIPTGLGGVYSIVMHMSTSHSTAPTYVELYARVNNGGVQRVKVLQGVYRPGSYWGSFGSVSGMLRLDDGDYVEMLVRINGGSSVAPLGTSTSYYPTVFAGARVGT